MVTTRMRCCWHTGTDNTYAHLQETMILTSLVLLVLVRGLETPPIYDLRHGIYRYECPCIVLCSVELDPVIDAQG